MKLYAVGITIYATAYVKAENPDAAIAGAKTLRDAAIELRGDRVCDTPFADLEPAVSLSPAMTIGDPEHDPDEVHDYQP